MRSFGDDQSCTGSDPSPLHFTGKPRDPETGLDYFGARLYSSSLGRWMSPDWSSAPEAVPYANLSDPQTLNLYAYAENNPVTRTDADGHTPIDDAWMQSGHMMQEVGFAFHLWDGQAEDQARVQPPRALASGPAAALPMLLQGAGTEVTVTSAAPAALDPATLLAFDGMLLIQDAGQFYQLGEAYGWWQGPTVLPPPILRASKANPLKGKPGSTSTTRQPDESPKQARRYGPDGYPDKDVDFDHDHGQGQPRVHDWGRPGDGGPPTHADRGPGRPIRPADMVENE